MNDFNEEKVVMISCGSYHSMALTESDYVFSWGGGVMNLDKWQNSVFFIMS